MSNKFSSQTTCCFELWGYKKKKISKNQKNDSKNSWNETDAGE